MLLSPLMKKKELLHYHALMTLVRDQIEYWEADADFSTYDESVSVSPKQVHKHKAEHREAVQTLVDDAVNSISDKCDCKQKNQQSQTA